MPPNSSSSRSDLEHLPGWMQTRCALCGEYVLPNSGMVASGGKPWQHFNEKACQENRERMATLPVEAVIMHQAIIESSRILWGLINDCPEDQWTDDVSGPVFAALASLDRGEEAHKLVAFTAPETPQ